MSTKHQGDHGGGGGGDEVTGRTLHFDPQHLKTGERHRIDLALPGAAGAGPEEAGSWLTVERLSADELACLSVEALGALRPREPSSVIRNGEDIPAHRYYRSFGVTPIYDVKTIDPKWTTYMYGNLEEATAAAAAAAAGQRLDDRLPQELQSITDVIRERCVDDGGSGPPYNQVVVNWFPTGAHYLPQHIDGGNGLSYGRIATLSLGAPRTLRFDVRRSAAHSGPRAAAYHQLTIAMRHGTLVTMHGRGSHELYRHGVPRDPAVTEERISLSFRAVLPTYYHI